VLKHRTLKRTARSRTTSLEGSSTCAAVVLCVPSGVKWIYHSNRRVPKRHSQQ